MKRVLGQGFDALFARTESPAESPETLQDEIRLIKTSLIEPRADQPRKNFDREQLQALANSISEHGVIQPIIVTEGKNGYYSIIAGERRWRAAKLASLKEIPAIVRSYDELQIAEVALIENLQREDLNPIEEALGYKTLMDRFSMTQDMVSEKVGKSRSNIANMLRLLSLEDEIKTMLSDGSLSMGHARALLAIPQGARRLDAANRIIKDGLSVRDAETLAKDGSDAKKQKKAANESVYPDVERQLSGKLGTKVRIKGDRRGRIEIDFYSVSDLTRIVDLLD